MTTATGSTLSMPDIIKKKRDGHELSAEEISWMINRVVGKDGQSCAETQIGALLMAIFLKGMSASETVSLTTAMIHSGDTLHWPEDWKGKLVDKHSTGGVGDKISLVLAPALAACGMKVPMISGRGLEHTGGTLDKLESIPGYKVYKSHKEMTEILDTVGCCIVGQSDNLVPADKQLYKTRDITATIESFPLIVGSIISKKAAENIDALIMDVKCGKGAFMKTKEEGRNLAKALVNASVGQGVKTMALLTDMDNPIGFTIGNTLEVAEALQCLHGHGPEDLVDIVCQLGGNLLALNDPSFTPENRIEVIRATLTDGSALDKFRRMIVAQGVDVSLAKVLCETEMQDVGDVWVHLPTYKYETNLVVDATGYVSAIDGLKLAVVSHGLGAGRANDSDKIDHTVGIRLFVKRGSKVNQGYTWLRVYHTDTETLPPSTIETIQGALTIVDAEVEQTISRVIEAVFADDSPNAS